MPGNSKFQLFARKILWWLIGFLVVSAAYLYAFPQANIFYAGIVLLHASAGVVTALLLLPALVQLLRNGSASSRIGWFLVAVGALLGLILIKTGTPKTEWNKLYLHIGISLAGTALLLADRFGKARFGKTRLGEPDSGAEATTGTA
ncbi:MAG TPA: hypothetical protein VI386_14975, partial [Candidatus Sulfotelmatobacter sp.]